MNLLLDPFRMIGDINRQGGVIPIWGALLNIPQAIGGLVFITAIEGQLILATVIATLLVVVLGCARGSTSAQETTPSTANTARLDLGIRLSDDRWLELADLRGTPVLLFVFATFDAVSQASLKSLRPFVQQHPEVLVIGIAAQPRASQLVEAWAYALDPPFVVGADPYGRVENGESTLGKIEAVPTYILYDAQGRELGRTTGLLSEGDLVQLVSPISSDAQ